MKKTNFEYKKADTELMIDGIPVQQGDYYTLWRYEYTVWEKVKIWIYRNILGHKNYGKSGVYTVTDMGDASKPFVLKRNKIHDL